MNMGGWFGMLLGEEVRGVFGVVSILQLKNKKI
jgi:hypothetical protein